MTTCSFDIRKIFKILECTFYASNAINNLKSCIRPAVSMIIAISHERYGSFGFLDEFIFNKKSIPHSKQTAMEHQSCKPYYAIITTGNSISIKILIRRNSDTESSSTETSWISVRRGNLPQYRQTRFCLGQPSRLERQFRPIPTLKCDNTLLLQ